MEKQIIGIDIPQGKIAGFLSLTTARSFPVDLAKAGRDMTKTERISKYLTDTINAAAGTEGVGSQRFPF